VLQPLELHAGDLRRAATALAHREGIVDVQRFGDRLDVMVPDVRVGERSVREALGGAGLRVDGVPAATPTLENTVVAILRELEPPRPVPPFPGQRQHTPAARAVAVGNQSSAFGAFTAVKGIDLEVAYGEVYGLLGANGAGKTTTIKMLCGLVEPSEGDVQLAGETGTLRSPAVRQQVGYMSQKFSLYDDLTIDENLDFFAGVYRVSRELHERNAGCWSSPASSRASSSPAVCRAGGKQRVAFGAAIMHEPRVLFLDEPTSGVDPSRAVPSGHDQSARRSGTAILYALSGRGRAVQSAGIHGGRLVAEGTPSGVKAAQGGRVLEVAPTTPCARSPR
jgi:ABC-2 type transport system ATP-binding protein